MRASAETLEGNKVKLTVEVDEEELRAVEDETLRRLTREASLPGFRPGKVPRKILQARLGPKAIREEVLRDALPRYYSDAVDETEVDVIAQPEIDVASGEDGGPLRFDAVVEVRPLVSVVGYEGLQVTVANPEATAEEIDAQVDRLRNQFAALTEVDRPVRDGDLVTLDVRGSREGEEDEELTDYSYEVGSGGILEGVDTALVGKKVGDVFELDAEDAVGGPVHARVFVKKVNEKLLPEPDDAFAADASEFETIAELRDDVAARISNVKKVQANASLRERALEALVELVEDEPPAALVDEETQRLASDFDHRLSHQQMRLDDYLEMTGQSRDTLLAELRAQAATQVKADLALRALALAEQIEVDESDVDEEIVRLAGQSGQTPAEVRSVLERNGNLPGLRSQLKNAKALGWLLEHVAIVDDEGEAMDRAALLVEANATPSVPETGSESAEATSVVGASTEDS